MITAILGIIDKLTGWGKQATNPDNKHKNYRIRRRNMSDKAIDAAEKHFFEAQRYVNGKISRKTFKNHHIKLWHIFFDNN